MPGRRGSGALAGDEAEGPFGLTPAIDAANRKNMTLLVQLRWIAVMGQIVTIAFVRIWLDIDLPLAWMALVLAALVALNQASLAWMRAGFEVSDRALLMVLVLDVAALSVQLALSGGATNPFTSLYLLQVTLGAVLLSGRSAWLLVLLTCVAFAGQTVFYRPLLLPEHDAEHLFSLHLTGMLVCLVLDAVLLVVFVTRITRNLRERDSRLAALRQHAVEEDHIVRMGLLAAGAAHELGTPLASLSVILGDWRRLPAITGDGDMAQELEEMQAAVQRCKLILTGILLAAGEAQGDAPALTSVNAFLNGIVNEWRAARGVSGLIFENRFGADMPIVSDTALKQVVGNVLDNALDASPHRIGLLARRDGDALVLEISDSGPGFAPQMLAQFGKPYQSSKGRLGGGLGLFLVVNVVRKLGGTVEAHNREGGGALVTLRLPLDALATRSANDDE